MPYCDDPSAIQYYTGFALLYSEEHEQPYWVAYLLTDDEVLGTIERSDNFREDKNISTESASRKDYRGSGYDRGHLAPAADMKWSEEAMRDSFFMSNMSPQTPGFNRRIWRRLEEWVRDQTIENEEIYVVTGPVLTDGPYQEIGPNGVDVPKRYFEVLLDYKEPEIKAIGFILPNESNSLPLSVFSVPVDQVSRSRTWISSISCRMRLRKYWRRERTIRYGIETCSIRLLLDKTVFSVSSGFDQHCSDFVAVFVFIFPCSATLKNLEFSRSR